MYIYRALLQKRPIIWRSLLVIYSRQIYVLFEYILQTHVKVLHHRLHYIHVYLYIYQMIGLFCKRALLKRRYSAQETYNSKFMYIYTFMLMCTCINNTHIYIYKHVYEQRIRVKNKCASYTLQKRPIKRPYSAKETYIRDHILQKRPITHTCVHRIHVRNICGKHAYMYKSHTCVWQVHILLNTSTKKLTEKIRIYAKNTHVSRTYAVLDASSHIKQRTHALKHIPSNVYMPLNTLSNVYMPLNTLSNVCMPLKTYQATYTCP